MKNNIDRRDFFKTAGSAALVIGGLGSIAGCGRKKETACESLGGGEMTYRTNNVRGDKVSILGYGCMRWPMIKDENGKDIVDQEAVNRLVDHAIENGVNYFDTAPVYLQGQSERATAEALRRHPRESYFIATKLSNFSGTHSKEEAVTMYRNSLKEMQIDYIDYYLLHSLNGYEGFKERFEDNGVIEFLMEERKAGRIRNLGFSFHGPQDGFDSLMALHEKYHWDFVQIQLNYVDWTHAGGRNTNAEYLQAELDKKGIQSVIMEPLLGGRLANVPVHISDRLKERAPQNSVASWAFRFAGTHPGVLCVLSGMTYFDQVEDNVKTFSTEKPLNEEEIKLLYVTAEKFAALVPCTGCRYCCDGCPMGLEIPSLITLHNDLLMGYNINIPIRYGSFEEGKRADNCIGCGQCTAACPQSIDVPSVLADFAQKMSQYEDWDSICRTRNAIAAEMLANKK